MFTVVQFWETQAANDAFRQWVPITLQGGGLFHVAMGAVLGVTAYGRTQEKLNGATGTAPGATNALPGLSAPTPTGSTFGQSATGFNSAPSSFSAPVTNSFGSQPLGGGSGFGSTSPGYGAVPPANNFGSQAGVTTGFGGKLAPPQPDFYPER